jgi:hypothetical protein
LPAPLAARQPVFSIRLIVETRLQRYGSVARWTDPIIPAHRLQIRPMSRPLNTTFDLLSQTRNPAAVDVLVSALDVADEAVQTLAVGALLKRRPTRGIVEVIRRIPMLCGRARDLIENNGPDLGRGLRDCLESDEPALWANALELVRRLDAYAEVPTLIGLLQAPDVPERGAIEDVIVELLNRLYERLKFAREADESDSLLREDERIRQHMLATLESAGYR